MTEKREARKKRKLPRAETKQEAVEESKIELAEEMIPKELELAATLPEEVIEVPPKRVVPAGWVPKTRIGRDVLAGKITDIEKIFAAGLKLREPEIVDTLIPNLSSDLVLIGGSTGKGGGIRRTAAKRTTKMHKSGRRFHISIMVVVGNGDGYVGLGLARGLPGRHRETVEKAFAKAKLNIIPVSRGCGSWECDCGKYHSIPFAVTGKAGAVRIKLLPAPKGLGLCVSDEVKKIMRLAGITDVWCKSRGPTPTRINLIRAVFDALSKLNRFRTMPKYSKAVGLRIGKGER
jgi:small subunit ribosomal protein S5